MLKHCFRGHSQKTVIYRNNGQRQNEQQRTVPNEFDNEGEAVDIDDLFSISVEGVI